MKRASILNRYNRSRGVLSAQAVIHLNPFLPLDILFNIFIYLLLEKLFVSFIFKFFNDLKSISLDTGVTPTITH